MKILALDYGKARVGLALGDEETRVAVGKGILEGLSQPSLINKIKAIVNLEQIDKILVGLPLNLQGEKTEMTEEVLLFVKKLRDNLKIPVQTFDERFTSQMADTLLQQIKPRQRKQDQVAAQIFLQEYLDLKK